MNHTTPSATAASARRTGVARLLASLRGGGTGAPSEGGVVGRTASLRLLGLAFILAAAFSMLTAGSAFAARGHVYLEETIGEPCPALEVPCAPGKLKEPSAVAVNEATGDIYVLDQGNARVERFSSAGALLGEFNGSGSLPGEGTEAGAGGREGESGGSGSLPGEVGVPSGRFEYGPNSQNGGLAVDNSCALHEPPLNELTTPKCSEFDPSAGDVYVVDEAHLAVDKYSAAGEYLGQLSERGKGREGVEGVGVDPQGRLWIYEHNKTVYGYADGELNLPPQEIGPAALPGFASSGFAVDSSGDFYLRNGEAADNRISKANSSGSVLINALDAEDSSAVSVDQRAGTAFVDNVSSVAVFATEGATATQLERLDFGGDLEAGAGVGVNAATGFAYVADNAKGQLLVMAPTQPGAPTVEPNQSVTAVTSDSAELHSEVNPRSEEGEAPTTWFFEYGPCANLDACADSMQTPAASLEPDFAIHPVSAAISGLTPGTAYHYRVVASNSHGPTKGAEGTFTTETPGTLALPDSRQWQLVSPPNKLGAKILPINEAGVIQAAADGSAITYLANNATEPEPPSSADLVQILSRRGAATWSSRDIDIPHPAAIGFPVGEGPENKLFSAELSGVAVQPQGQFNPGLSTAASEQTPYLHDLSGACGESCFRPLVTGCPAAGPCPSAVEAAANVPAGTQIGEDELCEPTVEHRQVSVCGPTLEGATEDLGHIFLGSAVPLTSTPGDTGGLYEWSAGTLAQVSVLPNGEPVKGVGLGWANRSTRNAISTDGSRIVFEFSNGTSRLYQRDMARGQTVQLDAGEGCPGCESGGGVFQVASADGSRVFFTDFRRLTADSGAENNSADLYECRIVEEEGELKCDLTDLTPPNDEGEAADVQGGVLGASADGSYLYFVAQGVLTSSPNSRGEVARPGDCKSAAGETLGTGTCNLYLDHDGAVSFITALSGADAHDWAQTTTAQPTRVSADGRFLELMSQARPTGYDNRDVATAKPVAEVYLYDAAAERLRCASCLPTGARPTGVEYLKLEPGSGGLVGGGRNAWERSALVAANVPGWTALSAGAKARYQPRYLSDSGRLFFNTIGALVPQDSNANQDVYQYEPPGVGGCTTSSPTYGQASEGCVSLISAGTSGEESAFLDASETGDDVFFLTYSKLLPQDEDNAIDVYDAHACSAAVPCFPSPPPPVPACEGDACQQPATPPNHPTPGTALLNGPENAVECAKGKVKKSGKCVARKQKKGKHKKGKKHTKKRTASHNRGGQK